MDRQRQAAVVLGERDVASDVRAKKKREREAHTDNHIVKYFLAGRRERQKSQTSFSI